MTQSDNPTPPAAGTAAPSGPPSASASPSSRPEASPDPPSYNWRTWFAILLGTATADEMRRYRTERDELKEAQDCARCERFRDWAFSYSPTVRYLRDEISALGHDINATNTRCRRCTSMRSGGFHSDYGILICANHMRNRGHVEDTIAHEMIHAYDHLRFEVERDNLRHQACTEIRASTLSGECRFTREFFTRSQWKLTEQLQNCVRRRAVLSLLGRPGVRDDVHAAKLVNEVWGSCFADTRPFDEIYR